MVKATKLVNVKGPADTVCRSTDYEKLPVLKSMRFEASAFVFLVKGGEKKV